MDFINSYGFYVTSLNTGELPFQMLFLQFLDCMPTQLKIIRSGLNTQVRTQLKHGTFQRTAESGFGMGKKRNMFHFPAVTITAIKAMAGKFQQNFPAIAHRFAMNPTLVHCSRDYALRTAAYTMKIRPFQPYQQNSSVILYFLLLKSAYPLRMVKIDRHCTSPIVVFDYSKIGTMSVIC